MAVVTHRNLVGLRRLVPVLLQQTASLGIELVIVDNASQDGTREWLSREGGPMTVLRLPDNDGPGAALNAVFETRPEAEAYVLFGDDALPRGDEVAKLLRSLRSHERLGIVAGEPFTAKGDHLAPSYTRRPFERAFPLLWGRWWGANPASSGGTLEYVDVVGGSGMAVRGELAREIGPFETILWPAAFEDLDYCARARFRGWAIAVDHGVPIHHEVSVTMTRVFGEQYPVVRRSSGLMYAALNYPLVIAIGRLLEAAINVMTSSDEVVRRGDAWGLLRCTRALRPLLEGRQVRRRLRQMRRTTNLPPWS
ncbi:MAG: glycosyltransferase family 2 protein [Thermoplasmata archaeon]